MEIDDAGDRTFSPKKGPNNFKRKKLKVHRLCTLHKRIAVISIPVL